MLNCTWFDGPMLPTFIVYDATFVSVASLRARQLAVAQHLRERRALRRLGRRVQRAGVVGREQALRDDRPQRRRSATRMTAEKTSVSGRCAHHPAEAALVAAEQRLEPALGDVEEAAVLLAASRAA